ncbi:nuclear transport factor 2 family protein [Aliifodinibius sp. S!AR15-10]|nr:nuclear transport factor 2 family protein [Aliifodinibius sp. S!AR15-10]
MESIQKFYQQWFEAMENADVESFLSLISDEFYIKGPNQPAITDKETLKDSLRQFHQSYTETVEWEIKEINLFDNKAAVRLSEVTTLVSKEGGDALKLDGVHFALLSWRSDGNWKLESDISSLNYPPTSNA